VSRRPVRLSTVPKQHPPHRVRPRLAPTKVPRSAPPARRVAQIVDRSEASLLDVIDSLLNKGVVLTADLVLGLANVDLVYVRLSALLCAADRLRRGPSRRVGRRRRA
jgi:hypothetical protein